MYAKALHIAQAPEVGDHSDSQVKRTANTKIWLIKHTKNDTILESRMIESLAS